MKIEKIALIFHQLALVSSPERRRVNEVKLENEWEAKEYSKMRHERRENIPVEEGGGGRESNGFELLHDPSARRHSGGSERGRARFRFVNNEWNEVSRNEWNYWLEKTRFVISETDNLYSSLAFLTLATWLNSI